MALDLTEMDFNDELEKWAEKHCVADFREDEAAPDDAMVHQWQRLFDYDHGEARNAIVKQRQDPDGLVELGLWEEIKKREEWREYDRLSCSHWLQHNAIARKRTCETANSQTKDDDNEYYVQLAGPIPTPQKPSQIANLPTLPPLFTGNSEESNEPVTLCLINGTTKRDLCAWIAKNASNVQPLFLPRGAPKRLSDISLAPRIGLDTTMPQYRLDRWSDSPSPRQDEYPVWFLFYGTLADADRLDDLLGPAGGDGEEHKLHPAHIRGGKLVTWGVAGYKGLIDGDSEDVVRGHAYLVRSREDENVLCFYETRAYEVVRCQIIVDGSDCPLNGCTFRYIQPTD